MKAACTTSTSSNTNQISLTYIVHNLDGVEIPGPLNPLANVLLVKVKDAADMSAGGIVLPDQVRLHVCTTSFV